MPCSYRTNRTTAVTIWRQVYGRAAQRSQLLSRSPTDLRRGLSCSKIWVSYKSNLVASWMYLHACRSFLEHLSLLLESLRALCLAPGGAGSIWKHLEALVRLTGVSRRFACGFRTDLHFADVWPIEDLRSVEALASARLYVGGRFDVDVDMANLLV